MKEPIPEMFPPALSWSSIIAGIIGMALIFGTCAGEVSCYNRQTIQFNQEQIQEFCENKPVQITNIYSMHKTTCVVVKYQNKELVVPLHEAKPIHIGDYWYLKATIYNITLDTKVN